MPDRYFERSRRTNGASGGTASSPSSAWWSSSAPRCESSVRAGRRSRRRRLGSDAVSSRSGAAPARPGRLGRRRGRSTAARRAAARRGGRSRARGSAAGSARPARSRAGPARPREHARSSRPVSAVEASTSNSASTRDSVFCACCPPGPLEREKRSSISERDGHRARDPNRLGVHGRDSARRRRRAARLAASRSPGRPTRSRRLRDAGHRMRFVTNNDDASRARSSREELRALGIDARGRRAADDAARRRAGARGQARARADDAAASSTTSRASSCRR